MPLVCLLTLIGHQRGTTAGSSQRQNFINSKHSQCSFYLLLLLHFFFFFLHATLKPLFGFTKMILFSSGCKSLFSGAEQSARPGSCTSSSSCFLPLLLTTASDWPAQRGSGTQVLHLFAAEPMGWTSRRLLPHPAPTPPKGGSGPEEVLLVLRCSSPPLVPFNFQQDRRCN